jgi:hypothetical protein
VRGAREVQSRILEALPDADLSLLIVWAPFLAPDDRAAAEQRAGLLDDPRVRQFWDPGHAASTALGPGLGIASPEGAWDVYLFFAPGVRWGTPPPAPEHWAHQLADAPAEHFYGAGLGDMLEASARGMLPAESAQVHLAPDAFALPDPAEQITFERDEVRPITELLLEDALREARAALGAAGDGLGPPAWDAFDTALRERFAALCAERSLTVPRAVRYQGKICAVVGEEECAEEKR